MKEIKAPQRYRLTKPSIFLAGSIEMGKAKDWQADVCRALAPYDVIVLNPRRENWDPAWIQRESNKKFREQVEWELRSLEAADIILFYFDPKAKSPISLLELGLFKDKHVLVCCPEKYWRRGNVEIDCERYHIPLFETMDELLRHVRPLLERLIKNGRSAKLKKRPRRPLTIAERILRGVFHFLSK